jgi:phosphatidylserine/phosphatidylglycerophosphate/cardiolipin synthase-like enzyme
MTIRSQRIQAFLIFGALLAAESGLWADLREKLIEQVDAAKKNIDVVVYEIGSNDMAEALAAAKRRGVRVRVIVDSVHSVVATPQEKMLEEEGVPVKRVSGTSRKLLHDKFILFDGKLASTPSYNRSARSLRGPSAEESSFTEENNLIKNLVSEFDEFWASTAKDETLTSE